MKTTIDLNTCKPGQKLRSVHGIILTYLGKTGYPDYPHRVEYPNGGVGSRTDNGVVYFRKPLPTDHNIIEIIKD